MKNISFIPVFAALTFLGAGLLCAQQEAQPPVEIPPGPLLKSAPEFSKWIVTFQYPKESKPDAPKRDGSEPVQMVVTKTGDVISEITTDAKNRRAELWHVGQVQYRKSAGTAQWFEASPQRFSNAGISDYVPLPANGFQGWDWIGAASYAGTIPIKEGSAFAFVPGGAETLKLKSPDQLKDQIAAKPRVAFVDAETRFPLAMRTGVVVESFAFQPAPTEKQSLPSDLMEAIQKGEEARRRLSQPAPRPY